MKHLFSIFGVAAALSLSSLANASVTYTFATGNQQVLQGATYCPTYSASSCVNVPTVGVYAEQTNSSIGTFVSPANNGSQSTESGLFTVTDNPNFNGKGIAPYDPSEGSAGNFQNQDGIVDNVPGLSNNGNILLLKLSDISAGSTLSLLLQAGVTGDSFTIYTFEDSGATPTSLNQMTKYDSNPINVDENGSSLPNNPQVTGLTIAGLTSSNTEWIAIQADCHYLLLDTLTITPDPTPEPRFYGLLLAGLLGVAGMVYQRRRAAQVNA
jgi:hypothetical protein